jgi:hypothetical protein
MRVVFTVPGMDAARVRRNVEYKLIDGQRLDADIYSPAGPARLRPAVVLIHGGPVPRIGAKNMGVFVSYGELLAASGLVAVVFDHRFLTPHRSATQFLSLGLRFSWRAFSLGVMGVWVAGKAMQSVLFGVPTVHLATLFGTALVMAAVSLVACLIPVRRAPGRRMKIFLRFSSISKLADALVKSTTFALHSDTLTEGSHMPIKLGLLALIVVGLALPAPAYGSSASGSSQEVAKRATKRAAKEATESAVKDAAGDATKKAVKKAVAPDALDLNTASEEQLKKLGLDENTTKKVTTARPFSSLEDPKIKEAIPADVLTKLEGKINVKPPAK